MPRPTFPGRFRHSQFLPWAHPVAFPAGNPVGQYHIKRMELGVFGSQCSVRTDQKSGVKGTGRIFRIAFIDASGFQPQIQLTGQAGQPLESRSPRGWLPLPEPYPGRCSSWIPAVPPAGLPGRQLPRIYPSAAARLAILSSWESIWTAAAMNLVMWFSFQRGAGPAPLWHRC